MRKDGHLNRRKGKIEGYCREKKEESNTHGPPWLSLRCVRSFELIWINALIGKHRALTSVSRSSGVDAKTNQSSVTLTDFPQ